MPKPKKPRLRHVGVALVPELYEKIHRIADLEDRSASAVLRRLIADLPEPPAVEGA